MLTITIFKIGDLVRSKDGSILTPNNYELPVEELKTVGTTNYVVLGGSILYNTEYLEHVSLARREAEQIEKKYFKNNNITKQEETKKMEKPTTQLEKSAAKSALKSATEKALKAKQETYDFELSRYIEREHTIISQKKEIARLQEMQDKVETTLGITKKDKADLF